MPRRLGLQSVLIVCLGSIMPTAASSADLEYGISPDLPPAQAAMQSWSLQVLPYTWLPFLVGVIAVRDRTVHLDIDPIQIVDHLTPAAAYPPGWAISKRAEARSQSTTTRFMRTWVCRAISLALDPAWT